jgi:predicted mannosyl-3-phosphoglycerate phosphatase (HAD superfamily)
VVFAINQVPKEYRLYAVVTQPRTEQTIGDVPSRAPIAVKERMDRAKVNDHVGRQMDWIRRRPSLVDVIAQTIDEGWHMIRGWKGAAYDSPV